MGYSAKLSPLASSVAPECGKVTREDDITRLARVVYSVCLRFVLILVFFFHLTEQSLAEASAIKGVSCRHI